MFQVGDKVICINDIGTGYLKLGEMYTIKRVILPHHIIVSIDVIIAYEANLFISIEENRRRKINKIKSRLNNG